MKQSAYDYELNRTWIPLDGSTCIWISRNELSTFPSYDVRCLEFGWLVRIGIGAEVHSIVVWKNQSLIGYNNVLRFLFSKVSHRINTK